jgi:hypothetical protein
MAIESHHSAGAMIITDLPIARIYGLFDKGGIGAEVGVKRGKNARLIFDLTDPAQLYLIDPWAKDKTDPYLRYDTEDNMHLFYERVGAWAAESPTRNHVHLIRDYSYSAAPTFADGFFDWVYIDAIHDYENVYRDLASFAPKLKPDGFLFGDDYDDGTISMTTCQPYASRSNSRLIEGVQDFCSDHSFKVLFLTNDRPPKFFLAKRDRPSRSRVILGRVLDEASLIIQVKKPCRLSHTFFKSEHKKHLAMCIRSGAPLSSLRPLMAAFNRPFLRRFATPHK